MASHLILLLVLGLCFFSVTADVFESIDCGSSDLTYTDENSIVWTGDDSFISNGLPQAVQTNNSISQVMDTLRVFTSRKKNCYSIQADKGGRVLVRASFYYGNYDQKSSPPTFDLQFDGNDWATVQTMIDQVVYYEVIYVVKGDSTSICLAQTKPDQFPFISALEFRSLGSTMYNQVDINHALLLKRRVAYGTNQTVRYVDDPYDRIWNPMDGGNGLISVASDAILVNAEGGDNPPEQVLRNAVTTSNVSEFIQLGTGFPPVEVPVYINMYFSEVTQLDSTQKRSFRVFKNNQSSSDPILPPYGNFSEIYFSNITVSSNTTFYLESTAGSTLPPLINAMEVFFISDALTDGTNSNDVEGLASLQNSFDALQDWSGDPCLPAPYSWDWVNCTSDATPRITALNLGSFGLSGTLPDFSSMGSLEIIDLHNNSLDGPIPDFLGAFPNLKQLNLGDNQFSGPIPASLSKKNGLNLVVTGNPDLCTSGKSCQSAPTATSGSPAARSSRGGKKKKSSKVPVVVGVTVPVFVLIWAVVGVLAILHHKRKSAAIAAVSAGQNGNGGANTPNGAAINPQMIGKIGMAVMNEFKVNVDEQGTFSENTSSTNGTTQQA
ncbi:uncharacterized protein At1g24485-like [Coffea arabica]|uniref:Uncharacterized protein At1g24485-like n=1 Tax=Coffea arabica TaxID=13443 RepID=A0A6P6SAY0_COFAR|nr:uncharacterized protein At1g24485-like [Coffea arabica]